MSLGRQHEQGWQCTTYGIVWIDLVPSEQNQENFVAVVLPLGVHAASGFRSRQAGIGGATRISLQAEILWKCDRN